jgi:serine/threonine protein kinase/tetratricopeptide (TPR) repeat protein
MRLAPGARIGSHEILSAIGSGGMGAVYRARDTVLGREVALKVLPVEVASDPGRLMRFEQEARLASALNHPNIVTIYGFGKQEDIPYIAMELVTGRSLADLLAAGPLTVDQVLDIAIQAADGLAKAHQAGIVHRDLKPGNLMVNDEGLVKIVDFGLSKIALTPDFNPADPTVADMTGPGVLLGTPRYMSPEQVRGAPVDFRSDQFSFGSVLYELACGTPTFARETAVQTMSAIIEATPPALSELNSNVPPALERVIRRCLAKNRNERYEWTGDLLRELREVRQNWVPSHAPSRRLSRIRRRNWRTPLTLIAASLLLALGGIAVLQLRPGENSSFSIESLPAQKNVAILPFTWVDADGGESPLAEGLVETITRKLTELEANQRGLRIIPAAEVRRLNVTTPTAARQTFNATVVVTGRVRRTPESMQLTLQVVDAAQMQERRSRSIDVRLDDPRAMQDGLLMQIAEMLELPIVPETRTLLAAGGTTASAAYESYLHARGHLRRYDGIANVERAIAAFQDAVGRDPRFGLAYAGLCEAQWRKFDLEKRPEVIDQARENCERAIELDGASPTAHVSMAALHNATGKYEEAVRAGETALKADPVNGDAFRELARAYQQLGKHAEAEHTYKRALEVRPDDVSIHSNFGNYYYRTGRYSDAAAQFREVVRLTPDNYRGYSNLGGIYFFLKRYDEALVALQKSLDLQPTASAYSNVGSILYSQGKYVDAAREFERAIKLNEREYAFWRNLAEAYRWIPAEKDKAPPAYRRAAELAEERRRVNPRDAMVLKNLAEIHGRLGNRRQALSHLQQALEIAPKDVTIMTSAAGIYEALGDRERALEWLGKALRSGLSIENVANDPGMADLRADPRFQALRQF